MISRTVKTLQQRCEDLYDLTKNTEFKDNKYEYISSDFSQGTSLEFYDNLMDQFGDKDISIVINNVGSRVGSMENTAKKDVINASILNTFPNAMLIRKFMRRLEKRNNRSAIVSLSSANTVAPLSGRALYGACKRFSLMLSNNCYDSEADKVDFLCLKPAYVSTPLNEFRKIDMFTTDLDTCAESSLKALGNIDQTYGAPKHVILGFAIEGIIWIIPDMVAKWIKDFIAYKI